MGRKPVKVTGQRVVSSFAEYFNESTGDTFYPSYAMIVMGEKLSDFYTLPQLLEAMRYFFEVKKKTNYFEFVNTLDSLFKEMREDERSKDYFESLEKETGELVSRIRDTSIGDEA